MSILFSAFALAIQAGGGVTSTPPTSAAPASVAVPQAEKKICRSMVMTGSIMPKRSCRTNAEWAKLQNSTDDAWETARRKRGFVSSDPSGRME